jgi:hypothetical protein
MSAHARTEIEDVHTPRAATRIRVEGGPEACAALRDYLLRLGGNAAVEADAVVSVAFTPDDDIPVDEYVRAWSATNGVRATIEAAEASLPQQFHPLMAATRPHGREPVRVGDLLLAKGMITEEQLAEALVESKTTGERLGRVLLRRRFVFESELGRTLAEQWNLPYLNLAHLDVDYSVVHLLPSEIGTTFAVIPVRVSDTGVQVAFADPSDAEAVAAVRKHIANIDPAVADLTDILTTWRRVRPR